MATIALALLASGLAHAQNVLGTTYTVQAIGPAWQGYVPSMGVDDLGRVAGCALTGDPTSVRAWTYDPQVGYLLSANVPSTVGGVNRDGTIAGSCFGSPTILDWAGNPTLVFPEVAGAFMAVNRNNVCAGYIVDQNNQMTQTAVLYGPLGEWTVLGTPGLMASAAYGINDAGQAVGSATDETGVHGILWNGAQTYLPGPEGYGALAVGINNRGTIIGFAVSPIDDVLPILWSNVPGVTFVLPELPAGFDNGVASAVNDKGVVVGSMWARNTSETCAFIYTEKAGMVDLNQLKAANSRVYNLVSAGAINARGQIVGIAEIRIPAFGGANPAESRYVAYLATPSPLPNGGAVPH